MKTNLIAFERLVRDIEANSWWREQFLDQSKNPTPLTYSSDDDGERITEVPKEPFESLLLSVRRLTMNNSSENLHVIQKALKQQAPNDKVRQFLDVWHSYWRLAFIKEPYLMTSDGETQVMTGYKVYSAFINGKHFHSDSPRYNLILYGRTEPEVGSTANLFLQNQFHATVGNLCLAACGLRLFSIPTEDRERVLDELVAPVTDFIACADEIVQIDEQYRIFSDWIEEHGGCKECRW